MSDLLSWDTHLFFLINNWRNPVFDKIMPLFSDFALVLPFIVVFLIWRFVRGSASERIMWLVLLAAVGCSDSLCSHVIKPLVARIRPDQALNGVYLYKWKHWYVTNPVFRQHLHISYSWPSCHASNIWTFTSFLLVRKRIAGLLMIPIAVLVCYSRIYLGVHYPLDVFSGAIIGSVIGSIAALLSIYLSDYWSSINKFKKSGGKKYNDRQGSS